MHACVHVHACIHVLMHVTVCMQVCLYVLVCVCVILSSKANEENFWTLKKDMLIFLCSVS